MIFLERTENITAQLVSFRVDKRYVCYCTVNGSVTISGHAAKIMDWGDFASGQARIVIDGATVFSAATHGRDTNYSVNANVRIGSLVDFLITAGPTATGGAFGPVKFSAVIRTAP